MRKFAILCVAVLTIVIWGGYYAYQEVASMIIRTREKEVEEFIAKKQPNESAVFALRRIIVAARSRPSGAMTMYISCRC